MRLWKVFKANYKSNNGNIKWKIGEWQKHEGELVMCRSGFHASKRIIDAIQYTDAEIIARVEVRGRHLEKEDKQVWSEMRIVKSYNWTKEDSVRIAIYAAELVIGIFEKEYPNDNKPRKAIEAAREWLKNPCKETTEAVAGAARAAGAAEAAAARAAWAAAREAARAAGAAAAAREAARAAWVAAWAARAATGAAGAAGAAEAVAWATRATEPARATKIAAKNKIEKYVKKILNGKK